MNLKHELFLEQLFKQALAGDKNAYHKFLGETAIWLRRKLTYKIFNESDVEDVVQEILVSIHKAQHTYDGERRLMPWLQAIATYRLKDYLCAHYAQKNNQKVSIDEFFDIEDENNVTEDVAPSEDVSKAIERLKDKQKQVIDLMYFQDLSVKEVAKKLNMSESAVKVTAHRAYKILRQRLNEKH